MFLENLKNASERVYFFRVVTRFKLAALLKKTPIKVFVKDFEHRFT